jgi:hypothetical protein
MRNREYRAVAGLLIIMAVFAWKLRPEILPREHLSALH